MFINPIADCVAFNGLIHNGLCVCVLYNTSSLLYPLSGLNLTQLNIHQR